MYTIETYPMPLDDLDNIYEYYYMESLETEVAKSNQKAERSGSRTV
ncbi:MAG: hypothetical protein LBE09_03410 [Christensenellaceae bacterium]|nr:hypothetical protein [Christensenellaceae bacterium]